MNKPGWLAIVLIIGEGIVNPLLAGEYEFSFQPDSQHNVEEKVEAEIAHLSPGLNTTGNVDERESDDRFYHWRMLGRLNLSSPGEEVEEKLGYEIGFAPSKIFTFSFFVENGDDYLSWFGPIVDVTPFSFSIGQSSQIKGGVFFGVPLLDANEVFTGIRIFAEFSRRFGALFGTRISILGYESNSYEIGAVMRF